MVNYPVVVELARDVVDDERYCKLGKGTSASAHVLS